MSFDVYRSGRCIVLDNLPPVVRLSWSDGTLTLAPEHSSPPEKSSSEEGIQVSERDRYEKIVQEKDARIQSLHDELQALTAKHESLVEAHRDLTAPVVDVVPPVLNHRFRLRNGETVIVTGKDEDPVYPFDNFDDPTRESRFSCWTREGWTYEEDGPRPHPHDLVEDLGPIDSDDDDADADADADDETSDGCAGCGKSLDAQDSCPSCTTPSPSPFQITSPGWYSMRNGRKVELRSRLDSDASRPFPSAPNLDYQWFAVDPERDFPRDMVGWPSDGNVRREPTWTSSGQWVSTTTVEYEYDVVSGPLPEGLVNVASEAIPQEIQHPKPLASPITGPGRYRTRDGYVVTIVERNDFITDLVHEWYGRIATESHDRLLKARTWHSDGWFGFVGSPYSWDLVERLPDPLPEPVRTFPSWLHPRYRYVARDQDGRWFAYESEPTRANSLLEWSPGPDLNCLRLIESDLVPEALPSIVPDVDWKDSLIRREPSCLGVSCELRDSLIERPAKSPSGYVPGTKSFVLNELHCMLQDLEQNSDGFDFQRAYSLIESVRDSAT